MAKFNWSDDGYFITEKRDLKRVRVVLIATMLQQALSFRGTNWQTYIPLRLTDIVISRNRPPGDAAVLANQSNNDPELALPVDELELQIFNTIDSHRTVAEIIQLAAAHLEKKADAIQGKARLLFEQLWWYDLVGGFILPFEPGPEKGATQ